MRERERKKGGLRHQDRRKRDWVEEEARGRWKEDGKKQMPNAQLNLFT